MKVCPGCLNPTVKARATNFGDEYDYCRTCKVEVVEPAGVGARLCQLDMIHNVDAYIHAGYVYDSDKGWVWPYDAPVVTATELKIKWDDKLATTNLDLTDHLIYIPRSWA